MEQGTGEFGDFIRSVGRRRVLTADEEKDLARRFEVEFVPQTDDAGKVAPQLRVFRGDHEAHKLLVEHNMRLVVSIAKPFVQAGFPLDDLFQEGCLGLIRAVDKFDPERGFKFSTYATWWIRQSVHRFMSGAGGNAIRAPGRTQQTRRKLLRRMQDHSETLAEAAEFLEIDPEDALDAVEGPRATVSLDAAAADDGDEGRHAMISDPHAMDPSEAVPEAFAQRVRRSTLLAALGELSDRQRRILRLRFGFDGAAMSLAGIKRETGASKKEQNAALEMLQRVMNQLVTDGGSQVDFGLATSR